MGRTPETTAERVPGGDYVVPSRTRSRLYGIESSAVFSSRILEGIDLARRLKKKRDLITIAEPFIRQLCDFLDSTGFFAILTDEEGCILSVIGDEDILEEAFALKMIPGAFMDEKNIGTNAMGTALAEERPVQISGDEHIIRAYHRWTCSGAPIRDCNGRITGALDLTGASDNVHKHTLGMVAAAVHAIETNLELKKNNRELLHSQLFTEKLINAIQAGILSCNLEGRILTMNETAAQLLGADKGSAADDSIRNYIGDWDQITRAVLDGEDIESRESLVKAAVGKLYYNISVYPVICRGRDITALILTIKDIKRVRKHANEITGRKAVYTFDKMIGESAPFREAVEFGRQVADSNSTILLTGESGTGKEIFAQSIQNCSPRRDEPFVVINCGAIPRTLIESELFGYVDGAFTGAKRGGQAGKFEIADGGTLFLDEIGEMPLDMQVRLLRVIEEGTVMRLGGDRHFPVDVRIIAASNKDLQAEVNRGTFRMDLYFRLNVLPIMIPPLRERKEDIPLLVRYYIEKLSRKINKPAVDVSPEYMEALCRYDWPGNIRELENHLELIINTGRLQKDFLPAPAGLSGGGEGVSLAEKSWEDMERCYIRSVLDRHGNNISAAARQMGIGRNTLYRKIKHYRLD